MEGRIIGTGVCSSLLFILISCTTHDDKLLNTIECKSDSSDINLYKTSNYEFIYYIQDDTRRNYTHHLIVKDDDGRTVYSEDNEFIGKIDYGGKNILVVSKYYVGSHGHQKVFLIDTYTKKILSEITVYESDKSFKVDKDSILVINNHELNDCKYTIAGKIPVFKALSENSEYFFKCNDNKLIEGAYSIYLGHN